MSNILWKNFHLCFSKLKCLPPPLPSSPPPSQPSEHHHPPPPEDYAFTATHTSVLIKNFNSLYDITSSENSTATSTFTLATSDGTLFSSSSEDTDLAAAASTSLPDLASVYASQRFFFSSPGRSNSIIDSHSSPPQAPPTDLAEPPPLPPPPAEVSMGGFTEQRYSSDPYRDFRRSMQEMVEARDMKDLRNGNWEYLHELLLCYLALNPKETHKLIIGAFTDIVILLMSRPPPPMPPALAVKSRRPGGRRQRAVDPPRRSV